MWIKDPAPGRFDDFVAHAYEAPNATANYVDSAPKVRLSTLLGPDGEPLLIGYERPAIGFDLSRRFK